MGKGDEGVRRGNPIIGFKLQNLPFKIKEPALPLRLSTPQT
jgi:hypothetical protein